VRFRASAFGFGGAAVDGAVKLLLLDCLDTFMDGDKEVRGEM